MKTPRQKKSRTYYYFWAFMALTGQLYIFGYGYRLMRDRVGCSLDNCMLDMDTVLCMEVSWI